MRTDRRRVLAGAAALLGLGAAPALGQDMRLFRIGTGGIFGTYYPIGGLIATIISQPTGARACDDGGSCGVPGLAALVQSSNGSVDNIDGVAKGRIESGFVQSDVGFFAHTGTGAFAGREPVESLRLLASLYVESVHLVIAPESGIEGIGDLRGRRVSLDSMGSGTQIDALLLLEGHGLTTDDIVAYHAKPEQAVRLMAQGALDAFFIVGGYPIPSVVEATSEFGARLAPIDGEATTALIATYPFFSRDVIPGDVYPGVGPTPTLAVVAQWLVDARLDETLAYEICRALWHPTARVLLDGGHEKARQITLESALDGAAIPLHPGAERYYREVGLLPPHG